MVILRGFEGDAWEPPDTPWANGLPCSRLWAHQSRVGAVVSKRPSTQGGRVRQCCFSLVPFLPAVRKRTSTDHLQYTQRLTAATLGNPRMAATDAHHRDAGVLESDYGQWLRRANRQQEVIDRGDGDAQAPCLVRFAGSC